MINIFLYLIIINLFIIYFIPRNDDSAIIILCLISMDFIITKYAKFLCILHHIKSTSFLLLSTIWIRLFSTMMNFKRWTNLGLFKKHIYSLFILYIFVFHIFIIKAAKAAAPFMRNFCTIKVPFMRNFYAINWISFM